MRKYEVEYENGKKQRHTFILWARTPEAATAEVCRQFGRIKIIETREVA